MGHGADFVRAESLDTERQELTEAERERLRELPVPGGTREAGDER